MKSAILGLRIVIVALAAVGVGSDRAASADEPKPFRAGAYAIDVSPPKLPVIVNGGFLEAKADKIKDRLHARCLVLDDGSTRIAIVVVDSCMMPRDLIDSAKASASARTGIPVDRMLISATHTHTAPAAMAALGSEADADYVKFLPGRIAEGIERAARNLAPAEIGWTSVDDFDHTHCRRWIRRSDKLLADPFGDLNARANMHPGHENPDAIAPSGPVDPGLSIVSIRSKAGRPIAVLANYSMHYFGASPVSSDYYGLFADRLAALVGPTPGEPAFVAIMSQGTSGDQQWMDYARPKPTIDIKAYSDAVAARAFEALRSITYRDRPAIAMAETTIELGRRLPDEARLAKARAIVAKMAGRTARTLEEVYSREAIELHDHPVRSLKLQAIRIGDLGIAAIPDEVYAITGLKIKAKSPLPSTFTIELANGSEGYIPPPEQHKLGGYTTWPARTAGLEVGAEPKIVETVVSLLEKVSGKPRRMLNEANGPYPLAVLEAKPMAYWRLGEIEGQSARDASGNGHEARFEDGVALYLDGPPSPKFSGDRTINRSVHLAGGRIKADLKGLGTDASVSFWFWNGLPNDARKVTGVLYSRGLDPVKADGLWISGKGRMAGRLVASHYGRAIGGGATVIAPKTWHQVVVVRAGTELTVYLDGRPEVEIALPVPLDADQTASILLGGGPGNFANLEGRVDEVAVFDRPLTAAEVAAQFAASR